MSQLIRIIIFLSFIAVSADSSYGQVPQYYASSLPSMPVTFSTSTPTATWMPTATPTLTWAPTPAPSPTWTATPAPTPSCAPDASCFMPNRCTVSDRLDLKGLRELLDESKHEVDSAEQLLSELFADLDEEADSTLEELRSNTPGGPLPDIFHAVLDTFLPLDAIAERRNYLEKEIAQLPPSAALIQIDTAELRNLISQQRDLNLPFRRFQNLYIKLVQIDLTFHNSQNLSEADWTQIFGILMTVGFAVPIDTTKPAQAAVDFDKVVATLDSMKGTIELWEGKLDEALDKIKREKKDYWRIETWIYELSQKCPDQVTSN